MEKKWDVLFNSLNEDSDLNCAVVATAYVDHLLGALLHRHFIESSVVDALLDTAGGGVGTLFNKGRIAYCLGLISKGCMQNIETIGKIRNQFAHNLEITFDIPVVSDLCQQLRFPDTSSVSDSETVSQAVIEAEKTPRSRFRHSVTCCCIYLAIRTIEAKKCPEDVTKYFEPKSGLLRGRL